MLLSIVVPVYNEEENIENFYHELLKVLMPLKINYELIFVDDGSFDKSFILLKELAEVDSNVRTISLARNFGHQVALTSGMDYAKGDVVITMDCDMQHPPELIPELLAKWKEGYDIVQTSRLLTKDVSKFKSFTSKWYYKILNKISVIKLVNGGSDFRLIDKKVLDVFKKFRDNTRFIRGIISEMGFKQTYIEFVAPARFAGSTKFSLLQMMRLAVYGILNYSKLPLRISFYLGLIAIIVSLIFSIITIFQYFFTDVADLQILSLLIIFVTGLQLFVIGILGEYISKIFVEIKMRPLYWTKFDSKKKFNERNL